VKDIDFLPEWYKEGHRHRVHMRHQYAILVCAVCAMITYNVTATHRINQVSAGIDRLDDQRRIAEQVVYEFDATNRQLRERQAKVDLIAQIDSKIDVSAVLAELSHIINSRVVLSRLEFISEPMDSAKEENRNNAAVRPVSVSSGKSVALGDVRFRIVMGGVADNAGDVGDLAEKLEESPYFRQVYPSVPRTGKIEMTVATAAPSGGQRDSAPAARGREALQASEFEITCYLANYEEVKGR
jgi:hypothetical protein